MVLIGTIAGLSLITNNTDARQVNKDEELNIKLFYEAVNDRPAEILRLIKLGADPNYQFKEREGSTPLMVAADFGNFKAIRVLLDNGGDPLLENKDKKNALWFAQSHKQELGKTPEKRDQMIMLIKQEQEKLLDLAKKLANNAVDKSEIEKLPDPLKKRIAKEYYLLDHPIQKDPVPAWLKPYFEGVSAGEELTRAPKVERKTINKLYITRNAVIQELGGGFDNKLAIRVVFDEPIVSFDGIENLEKYQFGNHDFLYFNPLGISTIKPHAFEKFSKTTTRNLGITLYGEESEPARIENYAFKKSHRLHPNSLIGKNLDQLFLSTAKDTVNIGNEAFVGLETLLKLELLFKNANFNQLNLKAIAYLPNLKELVLGVAENPEQTEEHISKKINQVVPKGASWQVKTYNKKGEQVREFSNKSNS